jgi:hypothetical protein
MEEVLRDALAPRPRFVWGDQSEKLLQGSRNQALLAQSYGVAAIRCRDKSLLQKALALIPTIHHLPTRIEVMGMLCRKILDANEWVDEMTHLAEMALRLPTEQSCGLNKYECLFHILRSPHLSRCRGRLDLKIARAAALLGTRFRSGLELGHLLAHQFNLIGAEACIGYIVMFLNRRFIESFHLPDLSYRQMIVAQLDKRSIELKTKCRRDITFDTLVTLTVRWHRKRIVEVLLQDRKEMNARVAEAEQGSNRKEIETIVAFKHETRVLLSDTQKSEVGQRGFPSLDFVEVTALKDLIRQREVIPVGSQLDEMLVNEFLSIREERRKNILQTLTRATEDLQTSLQISVTNEKKPSRTRLSPMQYDIATATIHTNRATPSPTVFRDLQRTCDDKGVECAPVMAHVLPQIEAVFDVDTFQEARQACLIKRLSGHGELSPTALKALTRYCTRPGRFLLGFHFLHLLRVHRKAGNTVVDLLRAACEENLPMEDGGSIVAAQLFVNLVSSEPSGISAQEALEAFAQLGEEATVSMCRLVSDSPMIAGRMFSAVAKPLSVNLSYGGEVESTFADVLLPLVQASSYTPNRALEKTRRQELAEIDVITQSVEWLQKSGLIVPTYLSTSYRGCLGRTLLFDHEDSILAYKFLKHGESVECLYLEFRHMRHKLALTTQSAIATPLAVLMPGPTLHPNYEQAIKDAGLRVADSNACLIYSFGDESLWSYVNELAPAESLDGVLRCTADLFTWLEQGEVSAALTVKNHGTTDGVERRYEWLVDICRLSSDRRGMGRLDAASHICQFPNVRATGIADLAELVFIGDVESEYEARWDPEFQNIDFIPNFGWFGKEVEARLHTLRFIGDYLLDLSLLLAENYRLRGRLKSQAVDIDETRAMLAGNLLTLWSRAVHHFSKMKQNQAERLLDKIVDFGLIARQLSYFIDPDNYVDDFDSTLKVPSDADPATWWKHATHEAEVLRALERTLSKDLFNKAPLKLDVLSLKQRWRPRQFAQKGTQIGFSSDGRVHDLGCYNGPWPLLELERALFVVSPLMLLWRSDVRIEDSNKSAQGS